MRGNTFEINKIIKKYGKVTYYSRCIFFQKNRCKAKCIASSKDINGDLSIAKASECHSGHPPQTKKIMMKDLKSNLKEIIRKNPLEKSKNIYTETVAAFKQNSSNYSEDVFDATFDSLRSSMQREKLKMLPKLPKSYETLNIFYIT